jgi:hypothetical protein
MSDYSSRDLNRRLDLCGTLERAQKRDQVQKQQQQAPQQVPAEASRGLRSPLPESYRQIDLEALAKVDPAAFFFLTRNRSPSSV